MKKRQKYITAGVTVLAAVATAHLMQQGGSDGLSLAALGPADAAGVMSMPANAPGPAAVQKPNPVTVVAPAALASSKPQVPEVAADAAFKAMVDDTESSAEPTASTFPAMPRPPKDAVMPAPLPPLGPELQMRMAAVQTDEPESATPIIEVVKRNEFGLSCGLLATGSVKDAAMVGLTLTDPCRGDQQFTLRHGDLKYTAKLNQFGTYMADIPALGTDALFAIAFEDGTEIETEVTVSLADQVERVAVVSKAQVGLQIHALEFGADYDQAGHVWSGNPRDPENAAKLGGGFVTVLGDPTLPNAMMAEVYTFPENTKRHQGVVRLSVETEVTADNCGQDIAGQTLQKDAGGVMSPVTLTLAMPDCDAIGEFLVLKNLLRDLKVASN